MDSNVRTVRVETGCVWADVDYATHAFGSATVNGINSTTGVATLFLFQLYPVYTACGGPMLWSIEKTAQAPA